MSDHCRARCHGPHFQMHGLPPPALRAMVAILFLRDALFFQDSRCRGSRDSMLLTPRFIAKPCLTAVPRSWRPVILNPMRCLVLLFEKMMYVNLWFPLPNTSTCIKPFFSNFWGAATIFSGRSLNYLKTLLSSAFLMPYYFAGCTPYLKGV